MLNLLDMTRADLLAYMEAQGEKRFHGEQVFKWIHQQGVSDFSAMTNLSRVLRDKLVLSANVQAPELDIEQISADGTVKWRLKLSDGNRIETVYIPERDRGTLCVSSQVGCALTCSFCSTASQGYSRNLTVAEIIGQVWFAVRRLSQEQGRHDGHITNVVMMGMGEPLLNYDAVLKAMQIMMDDQAYGLSKYRVTLSTSGVVPVLEKLQHDSEVALAVSLHAPNNELRNVLVPINRKYPLEQLIPLCRAYFKNRGEARRKITMEYVMLDHINDLPDQARELAKLLKGVPCKINLIPFNPFPGSAYRRSSWDRIEAFKAILLTAGYNVVVRKTRGDDIDAACGQLVGKVKDKTQRQSRYQKRLNLKIEVQTSAPPV